MRRKRTPSRAESEYRSRVRVAAKRRISVIIEGSGDDRGAPTLAEFLKQLEAVKVGLKHTERLLSGEDQPQVYFKIVGLSMSSPATVVLEETASRGATLPRIAIAESFVSTLSQIRRGTVPEGVRDLQALEAFRNVGTALRQSGEVTIASAHKKVALDPVFDRKIEKIIGPDELLEGSLTGVLLAINLHNTTRFEIYPPVGPTKVACDFPPEMKDRVIAGIDHNVRVIGRLRYKHWAPYPHAISAKDIEIHPPSNALPTLASLYGLARREQKEPLAGG